MKEVFIVSLARTPIGSFNGALSAVSAVELGKTVIAEAVRRANIAGTDISEVLMGNVLQANNGQAPPRQAVLAAGLPSHISCTTINKVCASGMKAITLAAMAMAN